MNVTTSSLRSIPEIRTRAWGMIKGKTELTVDGVRISEDDVSVLTDVPSADLAGSPAGGEHHRPAERFPPSAS